jgi:hypothetical protein
VPIDEEWQGWIEGGGSRCWVRRLTPNDDYVGAVACLESKHTVRCWMFSM